MRRQTIRPDVTVGVFFELYRDDEGCVRRADDDERFVVPEALDGHDWGVAVVDVLLTADDDRPLIDGAGRTYDLVPELSYAGATVELVTNGGIARLPLDDELGERIWQAYNDECRERAMDYAASGI